MKDGGSEPKRILLAAQLSLLVLDRLNQGGHSIVCEPTLTGDKVLYIVITFNASRRNP
jgi:hypothetical protein